MRPTLHELLGWPFGELCALAAKTASEALDHLPDEWEEAGRSLKISVTLMEEIARGRHRGLTGVPFALTEACFAEVKHAIGPDRLAVLVVDTIRSAARACRSIPTAQRIHVSEPTEDETHNRAAVDVYETLRLLDEIRGHCGRGPQQETDSKNDFHPMFGCSTRWGSADPGSGDPDEEPGPSGFPDRTAEEDGEDEFRPFGFR